MAHLGGRLVGVPAPPALVAWRGFGLRCAARAAACGLALGGVFAGLAGGWLGSIVLPSADCTALFGFTGPYLTPTSPGGVGGTAGFPWNMAARMASLSLSSSSCAICSGL